MTYNKFVRLLSQFRINVELGVYARLDKREGDLAIATQRVEEAEDLLLDYVGSRKLK